MSVAGYTHWTDAETATLRAMWPTTCTIAEIAEKMPGRKVAAVANKAEKLGLGPRPSYWTDERVEALTKWWLDGLSAGQIAKKMGVTRNVVIGKTHRLKLQGRERPSHPSRIKALPGKSVRKPKAPAVKRGPSNPSAVGIHHAGDGSRHPPKAYVRRGGAVESPKPVDIMGLENGMCKAVVRDDDWLFCGNPKDGDDCPYCRPHRAIFWMPEQRRPRSDRNTEFLARNA